MVRWMCLHTGRSLRRRVFFLFAAVGNGYCIAWRCIIVWIRTIQGSIYHLFNEYMNVKSLASCQRSSPFFSTYLQFDRVYNITSATRNTNPTSTNNHNSVFNLSYQVPPHIHNSMTTPLSYTSHTPSLHHTNPTFSLPRLPTSPPPISSKYHFLSSTLSKVDSLTTLTMTQPLPSSTPVPTSPPLSTNSPIIFEVSPTLQSYLLIISLLLYLPLEAVEADVNLDAVAIDPVGFLAMVWRAVLRFA